MKVKICTKCGMSKPLSEFHKNRHHKDGLAYRCKECANLNFREYRKRRRRAVIDYLGGPICVMCGSEEYDHLQIDHIHGDGNRERREFNYKAITFYNAILRMTQCEAKEKYRILCQPCNNGLPKRLCSDNPRRAFHTH